MTNGFCPIKDLDDSTTKTSNEFKSSEEESGLGHGEGSKDVSDQIENEDMLIWHQPTYSTIDLLLENNRIYRLGFKDSRNVFGTKPIYKTKK